jgi:hypothetical protein
VILLFSAFILFKVETVILDIIFLAGISLG